MFHFIESSNHIFIFLFEITHTKVLLIYKIHDTLIL
jgi:hypothetical protein